MTTPFQPTSGQLIDPTTVSMPAFTEAQIATAVGIASAKIVGYCGQTFVSVANDTVTLETSADGFQLPQYPVTAVSAIQVLIDGTWYPVDVTQITYTSNGWVNLPVGPVNWLPDGSANWATPVISSGTLVPYPLLPNYTTQVQVTYSHGYGAVPDDIQSVCAHLTAEYLMRPFGATEKKVGEIAYRFGNTEAWEPWVKAILDRHSDVGVS